MIRIEPKRQRRGFTLIELLVVMAIVALIGTLGFLFFPSMSSRTVVDAGDRVQGWCLAAKQQAKRDNRPTGIRLIVYVNPDPTFTPAVAPALADTPVQLRVHQRAGAPVAASEKVVNTLEYIQQPDDFVGPTGSVCTCPSPIRADGGNGTIGTNPSRVLLMGFTSANGYPNGVIGRGATLARANSDQDSALVQAGDFLEFDRSGQIYPIQQIVGNTSSGGQIWSRLQLAVSPNIPQVNNQYIPMQNVPYRIIRQPRRMLGEEDLFLPGNSPGRAITRDSSGRQTDQNDTATIIRVNQCLGLPPGRQIYYQLRRDSVANTLSPNSGTVRNVVATCYEILFSPAGAVVGKAANSDLICLWLCNQSGSVPPVLISIRTRTGLIGVYPVNESGGDPYLFARDYRASGM